MLWFHSHIQLYSLIHSLCATVVVSFSLVLVLFHLCLILHATLLHSLHWHQCWLNVIAWSKTNWSFVTQLNTSCCLRAHKTVHCWAKWHFPTGRRARSIYWWADVIQDMLTWLLSHLNRATVWARHQYETAHAKTEKLKLALMEEY